MIITLFAPRIGQNRGVVDAHLTQLSPLLGPSVLEPHLHLARREPQLLGQPLLGLPRRQRVPQEHVLQLLILRLVRSTPIAAWPKKHTRMSD